MVNVVSMDPDLVKFFDDYDSLSNLERLKRLKIAGLRNRSDQVLAIFRDAKATVKFRNSMIVLSDAVTRPENERTPEQAEIYAFVKESNASK